MPEFDLAVVGNLMDLTLLGTGAWRWDIHRAGGPHGVAP